MAVRTPTVAVKSAKNPLQMRKVPVSNVGPEIGYKCSGEML
jgi:hypothetical protein